MSLFRKKEKWQVAKILDADGSMIGTRLLRENIAVKRNRYPDLVYCRIRLVGAMPHGEEWDICELIDRQLSAVESDLDFLSVGIMTLAGKRDWILYAADGQKLMTELHQRFGDMGVELECTPDPRWTQYRDLAHMC